MNKPLYLSKQEMELFHGLRQVCSQGDTYSELIIIFCFRATVR